MPRSAASKIGHTATPLFSGLFQTGFVTTDLEAAQDRLATRFGIKDFRVKRDLVRMSTDLAFVADIIQPGPHATPVYLEDLPPEGAVRSHHLGHLVPDIERWMNIERIVAREGWATPLREAIMDGHLRYLYVDLPVDFGYYQEHVCLTGPALHIYDDVPAN